MTHEEMERFEMMEYDIMTLNEELMECKNVIENLLKVTINQQECIQSLSEQLDDVVDRLDAFCNAQDAVNLLDALKK